MSISKSQALTKQFYDWEQRGRGWHTAPYTVDLEPLFEPFWGHYLKNNIIDDGKKLHWLLRSFGGSQPANNIAQPQKPIIAFERSDGELLSVLSIVLPRQYRAPVERIEQVLIILSYRKKPISFEIIGTAEKITLQWTCREDDEAYLYTQLSAYFPEIAVQVNGEDRLNTMLNDDLAFYTVDFGLQDEFMRPVAYGTADKEPYTPLFGILERLQDYQCIALQILFSGTHNTWSESIMTAVCDESGKTSFFFDDPDMPRFAKEKVSQPLFAVAIRAVTASDSMEDAQDLLQYVATSVLHASSSVCNQLIALGDNPHEPAYPVETRLTDIQCRTTHRVGMLLNARELATFVHFPGPALQAKKLNDHSRTSCIAPSSLLDHQYIFGVNVHLNIEQIVGIPDLQRLKHMHVLGATGTGKSTFLITLIAQDIHCGNGCIVIDPHGDLIDAVLRVIPAERIDDVVVIDPSDREHPVSFNILQAHSELEKELLSSDLVALFRRFSTSWGDQMNSVLANALLALMYNKNVYHLGDLRKFLIEASFRNNILSTVTDADIVYYWQKEYPILKSSSIGSIITRLDSFLRPKVIRNMVCNTKGLDFASLMNTKKIVLVKLSEGLMGADNSYLLGAFIVSKLQQTAMARQAQSQQTRIPFYCYIDEFQHFVTPSMATILSGARKYGLGLILAHQDMQQVIKNDSDIAASVLSNAGTRICFRLGDTDAKRLQEGFAHFNAEDLQNLQTGEAIIRVNTADCDCNVNVIPFETVYDGEHVEEVIERSRQTYSIPIISNPPDEDGIPDVHIAHDIHKETVEPAPKEEFKDKEDPLPAKDVREHRYMQMFIKKQAEEYGYKAQLELTTPDGNGQVDVHLEKEGMRIAVEISVSTSAEWELHNIEKCITAGYGKVIVCTNDAKKQKQLLKLTQLHLPSSAQALIHVSALDGIQSLLLVTDQQEPKETVIKGYRVRVQYEDNPNRENVLHSIITASRKS